MVFPRCLVRARARGAWARPARAVSLLSPPASSRRRIALPPSAAPTSSSSSSSSSFSSSSTIAQLAPAGAVFLREPSLSKEDDDGEFSDVSSSSSTASERSSSSSNEAFSVDVVVVGVDHGDPDPSLGSFVLSCSPRSVVVETALCRRHGEATGNAVSLSGSGDGGIGIGGLGLGVWETAKSAEGNASPPASSPPELEEEVAGGGEEEPHVAQCLALAERLSCLPDGSPEKTAFWSAMSSHFAGEQLAYVAALSRGARLVFGDRPKRETVLALVGGAGAGGGSGGGGRRRRRLSAADLDAAVAAQASSNAHETLSGGAASAPPPPTDGGNFGKVYDVLVRERDATICSAVAAEVERLKRERRRREGASDHGDDDALSSASASTSFSLSSSSSSVDSNEPPRPVVVVIVGKWHVEGVRSLWDSGEWREVLERGRGRGEGEGGGENGDERRGQAVPRRHPLLSVAEDAGLRRALADELLRSTATANSAEEIDPEFFGGSLLKFTEDDDDDDDDGGGRQKNAQEEMEEQARRAYALTSELYGTSRMQLALLETREELECVVSGWQCDFWEVLEPVRVVRASKGGVGFDEAVLMSLRQLNFVLE